MQGRQTKRWLTLAMAALALFSTAWQASAADKNPSAANPTSGQGENVAMVNGTPISRAAFDRSMGYATQQLSKTGKPVDEALLEAGEKRLRPILMTTFAMIFAMIFGS